LLLSVIAIDRIIKRFGELFSLLSRICVQFVDRGDIVFHSTTAEIKRQRCNRFEIKHWIRCFLQRRRTLAMTVWGRPRSSSREVHSQSRRDWHADVVGNIIGVTLSVRCRLTDLNYTGCRQTIAQ